MPVLSQTVAMTIMHADQCFSQYFTYLLCNVHKLLVGKTLSSCTLESSASGVYSLSFVYISLDAVSQVLEEHEAEFFDAVDAKRRLLWLKRKKVISDSLVMEIESSDSEKAKELLFEHLHNNASAATLREYCKMVIGLDAFPKMQMLGRKILDDLAPEGLLARVVLCVVLVCMCM